MPLASWGQKDRADSIDIIHTNLTIDFGRQIPDGIVEQAEITFVQTRECSHFEFNLIFDTIYDLAIDGHPLSTVSTAFYDQSTERLVLPNNYGHAGDTHLLTINYSVHRSSFIINNEVCRNYNLVDGGLFIQPEEHCYYTLGEDRYSCISHSVGRAWHPCRDNFYERSTYDITITSIPGWHCQCSGIMQEEHQNPDGSFTSRWHLPQTAASYQVGIWAADPVTLSRTVQGAYGSYPMTINLNSGGLISNDTNFVKEIFSCMDTVLTTFERNFGPYAWNRVGFVNGEVWNGMEHIDNIQLGGSALISETTVIHEFAHQWFGNLVTCADEQSMWINEGGGTFAEQIANEKLYGKAYYDNSFQNDQLNYLTSDRYAPTILTDQPCSMIMGNDTYYKGWLAWHMIRGYMGDSLFYASMTKLFQRHRYNSINTNQLIDSLSLYSGLDISMPVDLMTGTSGYIDYQLDSLRLGENCATISLSARATIDYDLDVQHRVPVTFFSADRQLQADRLMCFDGTCDSQTFSLPFTPAFAIVDYHKQLTTTCTSSETTLHEKGSKSLKYGFAKTLLREESSDPNGWVHIAHHFIQPGGQLPEGMVRISNRYWQVTGMIPWEPEVTGQFIYNRKGYATSSPSDEYNIVEFGHAIAHIDEDFYNDRATLDSLALVYRADVSQPWQVVSRTRSNSSTDSRGYFTTRLFPGQYALAVIDTNIVGISSVDRNSITHQPIVYPNPAHQQIAIDGIPSGTEVRIYNAQGSLVLTHKYDGKEINVSQLAKGVYVVDTPLGHTKLIIQ